MTNLPHKNSAASAGVTFVSTRYTLDSYPFNSHDI